jgi:hypothetical protein
MERAMGMELYPEFLRLIETSFTSRSVSQLSPSIAKKLVHNDQVGLVPGGASSYDSIRAVDAIFLAKISESEYFILAFRSAALGGFRIQRWTAAPGEF